MDKEFSQMTKATTYLAYTINILLMIILVVSLCSCMSSLMTSSQASVMNDRQQSCNTIEAFTPNNQQFVSQKLTNEYKHISLTSATDSQNSPSNMLIGSAERMISEKNDAKIYKLNISAYLPNLKGDVYTPDTKNISAKSLSDASGNKLNFGLPLDSNFKYKAYLINKQNDKQLDLGELTLKSDKSYTLTFMSKQNELVAELKQYYHISVVLVDDKGVSTTLLYGKFY